MFRPQKGWAIFASWDGQTRFRHSAVYDFFRAIAVLGVQSAAPAGEAATQKLRLVTPGVVIVRCVKRLQD